jgi:hypothetical protein
MRSPWLRALLISIGLCGLALLFDLLFGLRSVVWIYGAPGMAVVAYLWNAIRGSFDPETPISSALILLADVLFWWLVVYVVIRLWRTWRSRVN